ncbi:3-dehydroquinate synthase II family protein [Rhodococcus triatomae]|uniref:3-amino-4-hydroxybenzoic acid synthase n=1 Tax=Rhodococcus triatomae TaxID=300028 RepID=A0A1G7ZLV5_9NOCA|nr:3-dehydroquinate synthase II family protein [Rhodococcus triatomae]QNG18008.1 3-dehydroquinate synthase II family protein [Rhodococcus triatomae]QNG22323.1 3-dehydroquinate synthase II family protein [Rhodococcus triatomae]SDH09605.1 3-amino-4-hydroxybenzoic acid synthase [Rhodococcus triatomae]
MDSTIVTDQIVPLAGAGTDLRRTPVSREGHFGWLDVRALDEALLPAVVQAALHHRIDGLVADDPRVFDGLPPTIRRILLVDAPAVDDFPYEDADLVVVADRADARSPHIGHTPDRGVHVVVSDAASLQEACEVVREVPWTLLTFTDPTKIPLEIVIAAAENSGGRTVTTVTDVEDAEIVKLVLEHGSDGLLLAPRSADDVARLANIVEHQPEHMELSVLVVDKIEHIGMGDRACIDTCSLLEKDEGCLIGSFSTGMFLSCSETHPLPYMPTRPFRWNAGAVHSYVLGPENRTRYVSELQAGFPILAVRSDGSVREVRIGRVKIEKRPLLSITATAPNGKTVNVITQDDWHVRLLGPGGSVNNVTELSAGDELLGYVPSEARHVGLPITEFCDER